MLIVARLLFGLSDSFILTSVSVYTSEIATKNTRGASCTLVQIFSSLGIVLTLSAGPFLSYKVFNMMFAVIIVVTGIPILLLPESPYFLYNKGQEKDAINVLKFLHGSEQLAMQEIEEYTLSSKQEKVNKILILKNPTVRKSLVISVIFSIGCQMVGYNAVSYYLQTILISTHTSIMPEIASVIIGVIQFVSSFLTMFTTDRFGRKIILITSLIGMTIGLVRAW
ncbi:arabinose-proton symporter-like [Papilio machaon]|uniref:arabinose-proton symporter-like n=1 Tax=Papilio machaon TaxID=76193 RepID=UPI001E663A5E|nr:arabinose-proton symporter-like [Papilio machaon]